MHLQDYLESKGCIVKQGGSGNVYTHCPFCNEDPSKRGRFYIQTNPESENWGLWFCHICNSRGGINQLRAHFGDTPLAESLSGSPIIRAAVDYYSQRLFENLEAYEYLVDKRGMTHEMITKCKFGWSDNSLLTYLLSLGFDLEKIQETGLVNHFGEDFLKYQITIPYLEYGQPTTVRGKNIRGKYMSLPGSTARLYGVDAIRGQDVIYLVAGEFDAAVMQMMSYPCAGVPGENIWKPEWTELVSEAKRIYIIFDPDKAGKAGAEKLATLLGETARVVELPEPTRAGDKIDISSLFVEENWTKEDFDFTISKSKGGILVSPAQAFDRWVEFEANPNKGLRFNIPTLDNEMSHGLIPGAVVTLLGRTNSGKSLLSFNIMHRMKMLRPDLKILLLSLEQTRNEWFERAHRLNNFYNPGASTLDTIAFWQDSLFIVDENRVSEATLELCIDQFNFEMGLKPDLVVVDYLGYYARSFTGEEYARTTSAIMGLKAIAKRHQLVVLAPHQANRSNDMGSEVRLYHAKSSGAVEETSDVALTLWTPDQGVPETGLIQTKSDQSREMMLKMSKSRDGGVNTLCKLQLAPLTLAIVPQGDPLYERAVRERQYWINGYDWRQAVNAYITGDERVEWRAS